MSVYVTGDIHGDPIKRFSFKAHPKLRELTKDDYMIVLGDCGVPFGYQAPWFNEKEFEYQKQWLSNQKYSFIFICGNHDDYDYVETLPQVNVFNNGSVRKMLDNVFYIDTPGVYDIADQHCLIIPGAESHDVQDGILDPQDETFPETYHKWKKDYSKMFRVKHWNWWEQEKVDTSAIKEHVNEWIDDHFDFVFTHDSPCLQRWDYWEKRWSILTDSERALEFVYYQIEFDAWFHGHFHEWCQYGVDNNVTCIYTEIMEVV